MQTTSSLIITILAFSHQNRVPYGAVLHADLTGARQEIGKDVNHPEMSAIW